MLFSPDSDSKASVLTALHPSIFGSCKKVIRAVLLSCHALRLQYVSFFVLPDLSHPLKASVGVSPLMKLFVQVAHFAVTRCNC